MLQVEMRAMSPMIFRIAMLFAAAAALLQGPALPGFVYRAYALPGPIREVPEALPVGPPNVSLVHGVVNYPLEESFGLRTCFIAEINGLIAPEEPGEYEFRLTSDEGAWLELGGRRVASNKRGHTTRSTTGRVALDERTPFRIRFFEAYGEEVLRLEWRRSSDDLFTVVPADRLFRSESPGETAPDIKALAEEPMAKILVFSKTAGFRHDSIPEGIQMFRELGAERGFGVDATEDASWFTDDKLEDYAAVVFCNTTQDVLNDEEQKAFERFIRKGRGFVGIHAAADTEYDWPWYGQLVGAYFKSHPRIQQATVKVADPEHQSCSHLPNDWVRTDEWYDYKSLPPADRRILLRLDTSTYEGSTMGPDHPIAWCGEFSGGRMFYTGGGHTKESYADAGFRRHVLGGLFWTIHRSLEAELIR
jgi:type 1 glutamine amidotransferase